MMFSKSVLGLVATASLLGFHQGAFAEIRYLQSSGEQLVEVPAEQVQGACGKKFVYRDVNKQEVHSYLHQEIVKASLLEQMVNDLGALQMKLLNREGHCSWVTLEELGRVKGASRETKGPAGQLAGSISWPTIAKAPRMTRQEL